jgi:hypothetical protein
MQININDIEVIGNNQDLNNYIKNQHYSNSIPRAFNKKQSNPSELTSFFNIIQP